MADAHDGPDGQAFPLAFEDQAFLMREEMRAQRLALDYERAELFLRDQRINSTVVVFGSARARPLLDPATTQSGGVPAGCDPATSDADRELGRWYDEARTFARIVSERGGALTPAKGIKDNVIATGGGPGLMEAANRGAHEAGAPSIGFNINIPTEQRPNSYITPGLCFQFHYFAVRKMHFAMRANALAVFPGGFGTLDELFEILTLKQTRRTRGMPVLLFCRRYWERVVNFQALADYGTISASDLSLFDIVDSAEEGWHCMVRRGLRVSTPLRED